MFGSKVIHFRKAYIVAVLNNTLVVVILTKSNKLIEGKTRSES